MRTLPTLALILVAAGLTGCSGNGADSPPTLQIQAPVPTPTGDVTEDLVPTGALARQLVTAAAATLHVPASGFAGVERSTTYYAYDFTTHTYWAAAALVPRQDSMKAQMSVQDQGSYLLFSRHKGDTWRVFEVGSAGNGCPVTVPSAVAQRWHWPRHACRPGGP
ncbi:MAG TPA: hypothetical protein VFJ09_15075 [Nocardioidaceae bacterium]|nr:hypothetical protein [Nocardioidaceae bacterium]